MRLCRFFTKEAASAGFDVSALELAENERKIGKEFTGIDATSCSFEDYVCSKESMSVVFMSQILEHALDVNFWIKKANEILEYDGILAIAVPNFGSLFRMIMQENEPYICPPAHLNFFNVKSLSQLLEKHGFGVVEAPKSVSRIPPDAFARRLPKAARTFVPFLHGAASVSAKTADVLGLGMMINVYGRKLAAKRDDAGLQAAA